MAALQSIYSPAGTTLSRVTTIQNLPMNDGVFCGLINMVTAKAMDVQLSVSIKSPSWVTGGYIGLYLIASHDVLAWPEALAAGNITGTYSSNINPSNFSGMREIALLPLVSNQLYWTDMLSKYVGVLPSYFTVYLMNKTGGALDATFVPNVTATFLTYEYD